MMELLGKDVKAGILKYILDFQICMLMQGLPGSNTNTWQKLTVSKSSRTDEEW